MTAIQQAPRVALFVTCLIDAMRPQAGLAAARLIEAAGFAVEAPGAQTCCGQPAFNTGDLRDAQALARRMIALFAPHDFVVAPSGSCAGMVRKHYPELFAPGTTEHKEAVRLAEKTFELTEFLAAHGGGPLADEWTEGPVVWHDSCACLRELGVREQPRGLLEQIPGLEIVAMEEAESCCGFGGLFSVKLPEVSDRMVTRKVEYAAATGAKTLVGPDMGCLMNIAGKVRRLGLKMKVRHVAEVLAGVSGPAIGAGEGEDEA